MTVLKCRGQRIVVSKHLKCILLDKMHTMKCRSRETSVLFNIKIKVQRKFFFIQINFLPISALTRKIFDF